MKNKKIKYLQVCKASYFQQIFFVGSQKIGRSGILFKSVPKVLGTKFPQFLYHDQ
jgi:hypothetical protein